MKKPTAKLDYIVGFPTVLLAAIFQYLLLEYIGGAFSAIVAGAVFLSALKILIKKPFMMKKAKYYTCNVTLNDDGGWKCPVCKHMNLESDRCEKCKMTAILEKENYKPELNDMDLENSLIINGYKCPNCGSALADEALICRKCGRKVYK